MKNIKITLILFLAVFAISLNAQSIGDYKDVVHFKNGTSIEGVIIENVPGESIKVLANDGKEYSFAIETVARFSRELSIKESKNIPAEDSPEVTTIEVEEEIIVDEIVEEKVRWSDDFKLKKKGYFIEINLLAATNAAAFRVVNGYRFGRFGNIGVALGMENIATARKSFTGVPAVSLNLVYFGELFNKRITPFYQVEAGYGVTLNRRTGENMFFDKDEKADLKTNEALYFGGPMGGVVLGFKFKTKRKVVFKLGLDARVVSQFSERTFIVFKDDGTMKSYKKDEFGVFPGLGARFGIGF